MSALNIKQIGIFFAIVAVFSVLLVVGANMFLKRMGGGGGRGEIQRQENLLPEFNSHLPNAGEAQTEIQTVDRGELVPSVVYRDGFQPARLLIDGMGVGGCVVILRNDSAVSLRIGVSPHRPGKDLGPDYGVISSEEQLIFDPRFVGIIELKMHNHDKPGEEFSIILGPKCQL